MRPFTISVEGNIGAGKSTFLHHFSKFSQVETLAEPVNKWRDVGGHNLLEMQYMDPERWCHAMQSFVQLTMAQNHVQTLKPGKEVKMLERSLHSSRHCFIQNLYDTKKMTKSEFHTLVQWYDFLSDPQSGMDIQVDLFVYLRTQPEVAYNRLKVRSRKEEEVVPLEYLKQLHNLHDGWLLNKEMKTPVVIVDADQDIEKVPDVYSKHESRLLGSLNGQLRSPLSSVDNRLNYY